MNDLLRPLTGIAMLLFFPLWTAAQISGVSTPPFIFDTTPPVPLSGMALGVAILLIVGFLVWHHKRSGKNAGV